MKILLLVETLTLGGLPNYVLELARALRRAGDTVALLHLDAEAPDHLDFKEVNLLSVDAEQPLAPQISALLQGWQPDLVHIHLCSQQEALNALMDSGIPVIRSYHDYTSMCLRRGRRRFPGDRCQRALGLSCALFGCLIGPPAAPGGAPRLMDLRGKLQAAIVEIMNEPATKAKMLDLGFEMVLNTPDEFAKFQAAEYARWGKLISERKITAN